MFCLQNKYRASVHFSPARIVEARNLRRRFVDFLEEGRIVSSRIENNIIKNSSSTTSDSEEGSVLGSSSKRLRDAEKHVHRALCDDFDTPSALNVLRELMSRTRPAMTRVIRARSPRYVYIYIFKILLFSFHSTMTGLFTLLLFLLAHQQRVVVAQRCRRTSGG